MFFPLDLRIKSDFFSIHGNNKLVFVTETECLCIIYQLYALIIIYS